jgi:hypothetical protein
VVATGGIHGQAWWVRTTFLLSSLLATASLTGCYATHEPGGGPVGARDAGPITLLDSGRPVGRDAGSPPPRDGGPTGCSAEIVEPYTGPAACSDAVSECVRGCEMGGPEDCFGECIAAEPQCQFCFYQSFIACANDGGCLDAWRQFACCTESVPTCAGVEGVARLQCAGECPAEIDEYSFCLNASGDMCAFRAATECNIRFGG